MHFAHLVESAEAQARFPTRLLGRQPGGDRVALGQLQVRLNLALQLAIEPPAREEGCEVVLLSSVFVRGAD
jgi:hypothetical protein